MVTERSEIQALYEQLSETLEGRDDDLLRSRLAALRAADVAEVMELFTEPECSRIMFALDSRAAAEVIVLLDDWVRDAVVEELPDDRLAELVTELPADDAADVLGDMSDEDYDQLIEKLPGEQSEQIERLLEYGEETAGGLMNPNFVHVDDAGTVGDTIARLRAAGVANEEFGQVYVKLDDGRLGGVVSPQRLLLAAPAAPLQDIIDRDPVQVHVNDDQEQVLQKFMKYDLPSVAVVDDRGVLVGQITVDDIMDVAAEEAAEDIYHMGGTDVAELETASPTRAARIRMAWLFPSFLFMSGTAAVILKGHSYFSEELYGALVAFVPLVGAMSGCCSVQTSTVITRGLATGELGGSRMKFVAGREGRIALIMAPACAVVAYLVVFALTPFFRRSGVIAGTVPTSVIANSVGAGMLAAIGLAAALGITMPFVFRRLGIDPAIAAGPVVTAANDVMSVTLYLTLSHLAFAT